MVLPIIVGLAVTVAALTVRSGLRAWEAYRHLSPTVIARMNNVKIRSRRLDFRYSPSYNGRLNDSLRARLEAYRGGFNAKMTESEAILVLDVSPEEIEILDEGLLKRKHRKAMLRNHPDKGGSPYLAMKINEAREVLEHSIMLRKS
ncbi:hypothetical protein HG536_0E00300 [Torulaspora globosa]|uniref:J domain-containing protein n=1 Tax=Torulaspora globosa TaxID=48254 RepID=A0A7G3ZHY4_9SACH|nr:uncharacterized protein HG536_0E00300 [Torulaspora globosa]QLL33120.1 hypothetical protein HG536_0E00300 [Torulaspora globosa]